MTNRNPLKSSNQVASVFRLGYFALAPLLVASGCQNNADPVTSVTPAKPLELSVTQPTIGSVSRLIELPADIRAIQEATLYAKAAGYVQEIPVDKGDSVVMGQVLARLSTPELAADRVAAENVKQSEYFRSKSTQISETATLTGAQKAKEDVEQAQSEEDRVSESIRQNVHRIQKADEAVHQAKLLREEAQSSVTQAQFDESQARSELKAASMERQLAVDTFDRYRKIYQRNPQLIAYQDVQTAQAAAESARAREKAAENKVHSAIIHQQQATANLEISASHITESEAERDAVRDESRVLEAQQSVQHHKVTAALQNLNIAKQQASAAMFTTKASQQQAQVAANLSAKSQALEGYSRITAPFNGLITKRFVDRGALIQSASNSTSATPLLTISDLSSVRIFLNIPEGEASFVHGGTKIKLFLATGPKDPIFGTVTRTSGTLDPKSRTLLAEVDLPNSKNALIPGSYATSKVILETHPNVMSLPSKAVGNEKAGRFVWVLEGDKAKHVSVKTGFDDGSHVEIVSGLTGKETIIADKLDTVTPGAVVHPILVSKP